MNALALHYRAAMDMLTRYRLIFQQAWQDRQQLDGIFRLPHESEFLPAALELQETPVSPLPRVAMWLIMSFCFVALIWAIFGRIDVVATAQGKIVPSDGAQVVQPMETATVKAIHVVNGQAVKAGEVLVELDTTTATADISRTANDVVTMGLQAARARALLDAIVGGRAPLLAPVAGVKTTRLRQEQRLLDAQFGEFRSRLTRIDADIARRQAEIQSTREIVLKLEQTAPLARQQATDYKDLVDKKFMSKYGYFEKERLRIEQEADLATQRSRLRELAAALQEGQAQRNAQIAETRRLALDSLNEAEQKGASFGQELVKNETRGKLLTLTAPVDGVVQQLAVRTVGGVVTPAQALLIVAPTEGAVEVEAMVENKDIGFVMPGQKAEVKIETFPFTKYGTVHAAVTHVSHDAINDEKRGLIYSARVRLEHATIAVDGRTVNLTPGMAVSVEIKTAKRRLIEYFLSPLLAHTSESLRER
ncbi:MAG TPA: HlyD family type I secretion periplasmic adaptor subunit [Rhodocyclaceae bacterium]|nr:HlyD family type I secretion periplasmic adaptor subunit [Rhodocyclaceae bacterium]